MQNMRTPKDQRLQQCIGVSFFSLIYVFTNIVCFELTKKKSESLHHLTNQDYKSENKNTRRLLKMHTLSIFRIKHRKIE